MIKHVYGLCQGYGKMKYVMVHALWTEVCDCWEAELMTYFAGRTLWFLTCLMLWQEVWCMAYLWNSFGDTISHDFVMVQWKSGKDYVVMKNCTHPVVFRAWVAWAVRPSKGKWLRTSLLGIGSIGGPSGYLTGLGVSKLTSSSWSNG